MHEAGCRQIDAGLGMASLPVHQSTGAGTNPLAASLGLSIDGAVATVFDH